MKKSTLLSLATAGAIVATSVGTFAAWDQTEVNFTPADVTIDTAVTLEAGAISFAVPADRAALVTTEAGPVQETTTTVNVKNIPEGAKGNYVLKTTATLKDDQGADVPVAEATVTATPEDTTLKGGTDDVHTITVKVEPQTKDASGKTYTVEVKAEIVNK